jgi:uncharacterized protein
MDVTPVIPQGRQLIQSFDKGRFRVSDQQFSSSIIVTPARTVKWNIEEMAELAVDRFEPHTDLLDDVEILLIGMGRVFAPLSADLRAYLRAIGPVAEPMSTDAACRTYNVLLAEDRKVAAALIALAD